MASPGQTLSGPATPQQPLGAGRCSRTFCHFGVRLCKSYAGAVVPFERTTQIASAAQGLSGICTERHTKYAPGYPACPGGMPLEPTNPCQWQPSSGFRLASRRIEGDKTRSSIVEPDADQRDGLPVESLVLASSGTARPANDTCTECVPVAPPFLAKHSGQRKKILSASATVWTV